jgi:uncharacterized protein YkwD
VAIASGVLGGLEEARKEAGIPALTRTDALDRVASRRARQVADLPFEKRMSPAGAIQKLVHEAGVGRYRAVAEHVEIQSGYPDPADAILRRWKKDLPDWAHVLDPSKTAVGLDVERAEDGMLVFAAVLLSPAEPTPAIHSLESDAEAAINEIRTSHGLAPLLHSEALAAVAREHSEDMSKRRYFSHETPEGLHSQDRVTRGGIAFSMMAENIAENSEGEDPVGVAVEGWMESPPHRANVMNGAFRLTGIGAAADEDGNLFFTQLFVTP